MSPDAWPVPGGSSGPEQPGVPASEFKQPNQAEPDPLVVADNVATLERDLADRMFRTTMNPNQPVQLELFVHPVTGKIGSIGALQDVTAEERSSAVRVEIRVHGHQILSDITFTGQPGVPIPPGVIATVRSSIHQYNSRQ